MAWDNTVYPLYRAPSALGRGTNGMGSASTFALCLEDGSALYGLPPAEARTTITNPDACCSRVEAERAEH